MEKTVTDEALMRVAEMLMQVVSHSRVLDEHVRQATQFGGTPNANFRQSQTEVNLGVFRQYAVLLTRRAEKLSFVPTDFDNVNGIDALEALLYSVKITGRWTATENHAEAWIWPKAWIDVVAVAYHLYRETLRETVLNAT
jgi:hypothetical protein